MIRTLQTIAVTALIPFLLPLRPTAEFLGTKFLENTEECSTIENYLGHYVVGENKVVLCPENIKGNEHTQKDVIKHELIHRVQDNIKDQQLVPEPMLTWLVRSLLTDGQTLAVMINYDNTHQEFEARVLQHLPETIISGLLFYSQVYHTWISN